MRDVRRIAVFRPNALGDFVFCLPALHALKHRYPLAEITYLGLPWHAEFLVDRTRLIDHVVVVPPIVGIQCVSQSASDRLAEREFIEQMQELRFDIALQMYGGGRHANPLLSRLGAQLTIGMRAADAAPLDRCLHYGGPVNRRLQLLEVAALAGAHYWPMKRELHATPADRVLARTLVPEAPDERLVIIQPGATDPRRRWPAARFAAVADALVEEGAIAVINGSINESGLARAVAQSMRHRSVNLAGKADLSALCGLLARAELVVSNDTGPLHLALALGRPCIGIYWLTNLIESAPLRYERHRSPMARRTDCPVCGQENVDQRCTHDVSFVDDVQLEEVLAHAIDMFRRGGE